MPQVRLPSEPLNVEVYQGGRLIKTTKISEVSDTWKQVNEVLRANAGKWQQSSITFAPVIRICGKDFNLNVQGNRLIANVLDGGGKPIQVVALLPQQDEDKLRAIFDEVLKGDSDH